MKKLLKSLFAPKVSVEHKYYAASTDLEDLERRMRNVQTGKAPWQGTYYW